jgi:membrane protein
VSETGKDLHGTTTVEPAEAEAPVRRVHMSEEQRAALRARGTEVYTRADTRTHGVLGIVLTALDGFMDARAMSSAASISYYALFSLFPIMIFAFLILGAIFGQDRVLELVNLAINNVLPVGRDIFASFLHQTGPAPTSVKLISVVILLWSASSLFVETTMYVEQAWVPYGVRLSPIRDRGLGMLAIVGVMVILGGVVLLMMIVGLVPRVLGLIPGLDKLVGAIFGPLLIWFVPPLLVWGVLFGLYMLAPSLKVWPTAALWSSGPAAVVWQLVTKGFGWWVNSGMTNYQRIYGSVATVVTLLLWMYISAVIVLAGAHLCAAIHQHRAPRAALS